MENEKLVPSPDPVTKASGPTLPKESSFVLQTGGAATADPIASASAPEVGERDGVFRHLVKEDADIAGLVAYSIYKQNKLDWLNAFEQAKGRAPNADELAAYTIGEGTARRLVTYRQLAEAMLAGGPDTAGAYVRPGLGATQTGGRAGLTTSLVATYALIVVLFLLGFLLAAHYITTPH